MLRSNLKLALRSLSSQKYYSTINIVGLAVGLAAFILITLFVKHELSYDRYNEEANSIYRIVRNEYTCSPPPMAPTLKERIPEIQSASRFIQSTNLLVRIGDQTFTEDEYYWTDNEFFDIFSVKFIQGDRKLVLKSPSDAIISETLAHKYFGDRDPMGKMILDSRNNVFTVAGVFKDFPGNSHFRFDLVFPIERYFQITNNDPKSWGGNYTYSYVKTNPKADMATVNEKLVDLEKELVGWTAESGEPYEQYFFFQALTSIHLHSHRRQEVQVNGDIKKVYIYASIALLILIISCINYINLSAAMGEKRHKEIGIKKVFGIGRSRIIHQFLSESTLVAILSTVLALLIVFLSLPLFGRLMERELSLGLTDLPFLFPTLLLLAILVGLFTGLVPSRSLSGLSIISTIRASSNASHGKNRFRNILITVQFFVTLVLIILSINVRQQFSYMSDTDPGYDKEQIVIMRIFDQSLQHKIQSLKEELLSHRNVLAVSTSYNLPHRISEFTRPQWFCDDPADCPPISYNPVDYDFIDLYHIGITEGRNFSKDYPSDASGAFLVNEKAVSMAGWESPLGMEIEHYDGRKGIIVGVVEDFHFQSMHAEIAPLYLMLDEQVFSYFSIRIGSGNPEKTLAHLQNTFSRYSPDTPFQYSYFDEEFTQLYKAEKRLGSIFVYFSTLAIILGCLGLFGMSAYMISQRTKELGIRKIFGAKTLDNMLLLGRKLMIPVFFANILAWPLAFIAIGNWLENFAYRTNISVWSFLTAAVAVLFIAALTIGLNSHKVAQQAPVSSLKTE